MRHHTPKSSVLKSECQYPQLTTACCQHHSGPFFVFTVHFSGASLASSEGTFDISEHQK